MKAFSLARGVAIPLALLTTTAMTTLPTVVSAQTVVIGSEAAVPPLDPHRTNGTQAIRVIDAVFDPLVREDLTVVSDAAQPLIGGLAQSWNVSADGLAYHFDIRPGVKFHDGSDLDANVVQLNFDRLLDAESPVYDERAAGNMRFATRWIESTSVVDPMTFEIKLKSSFAGFLRLLSDRRIAIISADALQNTAADELGLNPVGTGPFRVAEYRQGQNIEMTRNDTYWGKQPGVEQLIFRVVPDPTALAIAMQTGQVDILPSASSEQVAQLSADPTIQIQYPEPANQYFLRLNLKAKYTENKLFRQALNYAVNRENIAALLNNQVTPLGQPIPTGNEVSAAGVPSYSYDPEKAKALLEEAGITTPVGLNFMTPANGPGLNQGPQLMSLIQQDFAEVGVNISVQPIEFTTWLTVERPGYQEDLAGSLTGWTTGADAGYWFERMLGGDQIPPSGVNRGWYVSEEVDGLFAKARVELDDDKRGEFYRAAAAQITDDAPWVFLYQDKLARALSARITGIESARSVLLDYPNLGVK